MSKFCTRQSAVNPEFCLRGTEGNRFIGSYLGCKERSEVEPGVSGSIYWRFTCGNSLTPTVSYFDVLPRKLHAGNKALVLEGGIQNAMDDDSTFWKINRFAAIREKKMNACVCRSVKRDSKSDLRIARVQLYDQYLSYRLLYNNNTQFFEYLTIFYNKNVVGNCFYRSSNRK